MNNVSKKMPLRFCIIGLGPRGLIVLERILSFARQNPALSVLVSIAEPEDLGTGSHSIKQPDYLMLNTVASQLTMFPGNIGSKCDAHYGPNLFDWCMSRIAFDDGKSDADSIGKHSVEPTDFLPRSYLGRYLAWFGEYLLWSAPPTVSISVHRALAVDIEPMPGSSQLHVVLNSNHKILADEVFITIGHCKQNFELRSENVDEPSLKRVNGASKTVDLKDGSRVAIDGLGLTAMDAMVRIVNEWGGKFKNENGEVKYVASGREGKIVFRTRSGLPYFARPNIEVSRVPHKAAVLTEQMLSLLTSKDSYNNLDFEKHVLPLMKIEMNLAYQQTLAKLESDRIMKEFDPSMRIEISSASDNVAGQQIDDFFLNSAPYQNDSSAYNDWFLKTLRDDVTESKRGINLSPIKAAMEVWRDLRAELRVIIDSPNLCMESRKTFFADFSPLINRLVAGPELRRLEELKALLEAGVAEVFWINGADRNNPPTVDLLTVGRVGMAGFGRKDSPLLENLLKKGFAAKISSASGLDCIKVDRMGHLLNADGVCSANLWAFGPPTEGMSYYNHYIPSPGIPTRAYVDAHQAIDQCFQKANSEANFAMQELKVISA